MRLGNFHPGPLFRLAVYGLVLGLIFEVTSNVYDLAEEIGLDRKLFYAELSGAAVQDQLKEEVAFARSAPINGFPSLVLRIPTGLNPVVLDYRDAAPMLKQIEAALMINSSPGD